jgi:hypothetical protein
MENPIRNLIFFSQSDQHFCNNWLPIPKPFQRFFWQKILSGVTFLVVLEVSQVRLKKKQTNKFLSHVKWDCFKFDLRNNISIQRKNSDLKIATVLSQSDHSISIRFFFGIKIDYCRDTSQNVRVWHFLHSFFWKCQLSDSLSSLPRLGLLKLGSRSGWMHC